MKRKPAVANAFYYGSPARLKDQVAALVDEHQERKEAMGVVSPHAGFMYSGSVAGAVYSRVKLPGTLILLGPNHTGYGAAASIMAEGSWEMPFGAVEMDSALANRLLRLSPSLREDYSAHTMEHSLEVQLPFVQHFSTDFKIVPIVLMRMSLEECEKLGSSIAEAVREAGEKILIVASTDMTHYESHEAAREKDMKAIARILALDHRGLYETVSREGITMCGYVPATVMLAACKELGATESLLVRYQTSGDVSGDYGSVVGYAGLIIR